MLRVVLVAMAALVAVVVVRTLTYSGGEAVLPAAPPAGDEPVIDAGIVAAHLSRAVTFATVSLEPPATRDQAAFDGFLAWLENTYPRVFAELDVARINDSLLLRWPGTGGGGQPVLMAAHYDVVPASPGAQDRWTHPPFAGTVADGYVWGRGALDNKNAVIGLLEAVSWMLEQGERPARTVYFSFGHDEELGGSEGASAVVETLRSDGVKLAWSLDEGSFVFEGMFSGVERPIALINVAEKGYATLRVIATGEGGHSSVPPRETATGRLARAVVALEEHPMPGGLDGLPGRTFDAVAAHMPLLPRALFANRWLFGPLVEGQLEALPYANAMLRTTTAPTMLEGSPKANVLPVEAVATVNFRIHPRDSVDDVVRHVSDLVADEHVRVELVEGNPASAVSDPDGAGFRRLAGVIAAEFPDAIVAPGLLVAATDSRHYGAIAGDAYRFNPMVVSQSELGGFHGIDERIRISGLVKGVKSYVRLLRGL